jgi:LysM repeat protein
MSPEKVAILVVAGLIAVLLAVALLGTESNGNGPAAGTPKAAAAPENVKIPPKQIESYTYEDIVRGTARPRPEVRPVSAESRPSVATVEYVVRKDDTLERIARRELGGREQVGKILALNKGLNPSKLRIGSKILLPVVQRESRSVAEAPKPEVAKADAAKSGAAKTDAAKSKAKPASTRRPFEPVAAKSTRGL